MPCPPLSYIILTVLFWDSFPLYLESAKKIFLCVMSALAVLGCSIFVFKNRLKTPTDKTISYITGSTVPFMSKFVTFLNNVLECLRSIQTFDPQAHPTNLDHAL